MNPLQTRRGHIEAPYTTFTGAIMNQIMVDGYNRNQDEINRWIDDGREVPEHLLNESHRFINTCANLHNGAFFTK